MRVRFVATYPGRSVGEIAELSPAEGTRLANLGVVEILEPQVRTQSVENAMLPRKGESAVTR